mgnify:CR=1 FL=1
MKTRKNYAQITEQWLRANNLKMVRFKDYLGIERSKVVKA